MTNPPTVFAIVEASETDVPHIEAAVAVLACSSLAELACLQHDVYRPEREPGRLIIHDIWKDEEGLDLHRRSEPVARFKRALADSNATLAASVYRRLQLPSRMEKREQDDQQVFR